MKLWLGASALVLASCSSEHGQPASNDAAVSQDLSASLRQVAASASGRRPTKTTFDMSHVIAPRIAPTRFELPAQVQLPLTADAPFVIASGGMTLRTRIVGAAASHAQIVENAVVYADALEHGSLLHVPLATGTEEFAYFLERPKARVVRYEVSLEHVAGLRLVGDSLEFLAEDGNPVLRTTAAWLVDADGNGRHGHVAVEGCAVDTDEHPPWGRKPVAPGADKCTVVSSWDDAGLRYPLLVDPPWTTTGVLAQPRHNHAAALVANSTNAACTQGCVVVTGGFFGSSTLPSFVVSTAELYNASKGTWAAAGTPSVDPARFSHTSFPSGRGAAYIVGGTRSFSYGTDVLASTSIYDPNATPAWTTGPSLTNARYGLVSQWLRFPDAAAPGGQADQVVIVGGTKSDNTVSNDADYMSTAGGALWSAWNASGKACGGSFFPCLGTARTSPAITGWVTGGKPTVIIGGGGLGSGSWTSSVEYYDGGGLWVSAGSLSAPRSSLAAATVTDGVLFAGGYEAAAVATIDKFVFATKKMALSWAPMLSVARSSLTGTTAGVTPRAFFHGGNGPTDMGFVNGITRADVFTGDGSGASITSDASQGRTAHTATRLPNGAVLVAGGYKSHCVPPTCSPPTFNAFTYPTAEEVYRPEANGVACSADGDCESLHCVDGVCCDSACNGQCEACDVTATKGTCSAVTGAVHGSRTACDKSGTTCGAKCDGVNRTACTYATSSVTCAAATCDSSSNTQTAVSTCSGSGSCLTPAATSCKEYKCGATACKTTCTTTADCATGYACVGSTCVTTGGLGTVCTDDTQCTSKHCVTSDGTSKVCCTDASCPTGSICAGTSAGAAAGTCLKQNGTACGASTECTSGFCVDGVCCDALCGGQCEACDVSGAIGKCQGVNGAVHGTRPVCSDGGGDVCKALACDGGKDRTKCATYAAGLDKVCAAASCKNGTLTAAATCDGMGSCGTGKVTTCAPYACGDTACKTSCATDTDCSAGNACTSGTCGPRAPSTCTADGLSSQPGDTTKPAVACAPYRCEPSAGTCFTSCTSTDSCAPGYLCEGGACTPGNASSQETDSSSGGCGCEVVGTTTTSSKASLPLAAIAALLVLARRRSGAKR